MRALVTGATSLVGRTIVEKLVHRGDEVTVFQRSSSGLGVEEHLGDISDRGAVKDAMAGAEAVVHVAAKVSVSGPWQQFRQVNVEGTRNVVDAAAELGVSRFVQVSSPSVAYSGHALVGAGAGPADPAATRGHYAASKAEAEVIALKANSADMCVVAVRPHLIWGPGDKQLVGRIVARARSGRLAIIGSGAALIDTIYVDNAADAIVAALDRAPSVAGRAFVVTNGQPRTVREMVNRIVMAAGLQPPRVRVPYQVARIGGGVAERVWEVLPGDDEPPMTSFLAEQLGTAHWFDQREVTEALDWSPAVGLAEGFDRLRSWFLAEKSPVNQTGRPGLNS